MEVSISSRRISNVRVIPACPPTPSAQHCSRPRPTAFAPKASALHTSTCHSSRSSSTTHAPSDAPRHNARRHPRPWPHRGPRALPSSAVPQAPTPPTSMTLQTNENVGKKRNPSTRCPQGIGTTVAHQPDTVSPRNRNLSQKCRAPTGAAMSSMNRTRTHRHLQVY
jgi:hypothetical protein